MNATALSIESFDSALRLDPAKARIGVIGLGYVGLPLAVEFGQHFPTIGFDLNQQRIDEIDGRRDRTGEVSASEFEAAEDFSCSADLNALTGCNFYIVTVPTPIDEFKNPDLRAMIAASNSIGPLLKQGDVVVYESTVYPGVTEDVCAPILAELSGLTLNEGFFVGYSPERINPGDRERRVATITKVTAGSTPEAAEYIDKVYGRVIRAGTFRAKSIRVAEAAKVIENTQRDVNIALVNEFAELFHRLGFEYSDVLAAARTKWNFLPFEPGLVGGHCIGVDPYYLSHKAREVDFHPQLINAARRINDRMGRYVGQRIVKQMLANGTQVLGSRVLVLGFTFKEDCPDIRNAKAVDVVRELIDFGVRVDVHDPIADPDECEHEYGTRCDADYSKGGYDAVVVAVRHKEFRAMGAKAVTKLLTEGGLVFDLKNTFPELVDALRL
ncbi:MAG: nucleotide sugar dehydrogenase [Gammaproteobacteria bacterium]